ncbi:MAG: RNA methyltransferase [Flavobacteriales bacterium]|nr:RNA methyltransferase [Flavobacteriales bacterium]
MIITSLQNSKIKFLQKLLDKSRERKKNKLFTVEGIQENEFALNNNYKPKEFYVCESIYNGDLDLSSEVNYISSQVYQKVAFRGSTEGIIGVYHQKENILEEDLSENSTVLIVESVEKPGNLGAILRTCEAFSVDLVLICDERVDIYNPNVIRSSVGCVFSVPTLSLSKEECYEFCKKQNIKLYSTFMNEEYKSIWEVNYRTKSGLIFGTEHEGVSDFWKDKIEMNVLIPISGTVDSFNVSNAIAIGLYEVYRQKNVT